MGIDLDFFSNDRYFLSFHWKLSQLQNKTINFQNIRFVFSKRKTMEKNRFKKSKSENEKKYFCFVLNDEQAISFFVSEQNEKRKTNYIWEGERGLPVIYNVI